MISRETYLNQLKPFIDKPLVKILTGIRRSGKSTVLRLLQNELLANGISADDIFLINLESFTYSEIRNAVQLHSYIVERASKNKRVYILLDEIQEVEEWEKAVNSFMVDLNADIYLTGSNSHLLSSELATYLAGRYIEIPVYTLSFTESRAFRKECDIPPGSFLSYLRMGGFPILHTSDYTEETAYKIVYDIYSSVILRDTIQRYKIRDVELLERVIKYAFDNVGKTFSGKNVADYFKSQHRKIDINTVYNYLHALEGAFILYRIPRYDVKGKEILKTQEKFYVSDVSLIYATLGFRDRMMAGILENIVFLELKRRGYRVFIGKVDTREIDFIAERTNEKIYIQVTYKLESPETIEREYGTLLALEDHYPKYVVSMDEVWKDNINGVKHLHIQDFLISKDW